MERNDIELGVVGRDGIELLSWGEWGRRWVEVDPALRATQTPRQAIDAECSRRGRTADVHLIDHLA